MEGRLDMATRKRLTNRFKAEYAKGDKKQKGEILDRLEAVGMGRSTARRLLTQAEREKPVKGAARGRRPKYDAGAQRLLERLWLLMGMPCGPYMKAMFDQWIPALLANGELDGIDGDALDQVLAMSPSTIDRRLRPLKQAAMPKGASLTRPAAEHMRNSIRIRKCTDETIRVPGLAEADTVAHCGPSMKGEFARTLTMVDYATNWTVNVTARNNAKSN
ncbi:integrase core domain-containing protein, partial [Bifidobacterium lemurum]